MIRCPIYCCDKLLGCNACKRLNKLVPANKELQVVTISDPQWVEYLHKDNIGLIIDHDVSRDVVWELSCNSKNFLQMNCCLVDTDLQWVVNLVHLAEVCGIKCSVVMYPILPSIVTTAKVIRILDAIKNCENCTVALNFGILQLSSSECKEGQLRLKDKSLPLKNLNKTNRFLWKCRESYAEEFYQIVNFYTDSTKLNLIVI